MVRRITDTGNIRRTILRNPQDSGRLLRSSLSGSHPRSFGSAENPAGRARMFTAGLVVHIPLEEAVAAVPELALAAEAVGAVRVRATAAVAATTILQAADANHLIKVFVLSSTGPRERKAPSGRLFLLSRVRKGTGFVKGRTRALTDTAESLRIGLRLDAGDYRTSIESELELVPATIESGCTPDPASEAGSRTFTWSRPGYCP